jgi:hypothetical protein
MFNGALGPALLRSACGSAIERLARILFKYNW